MICMCHAVNMTKNNSDEYSSFLKQSLISREYRENWDKQASLLYCAPHKYSATLGDDRW